MAKNKYIDVILRLKDQMSAGIGKSVTRLQESQKTLENYGKKFEKAGQNIQKTGKTLTKGISAPIAGIAVASVKTAADFEAGMSNVQAISGATGKQLETLKNKALEMGRKTKFTARESSDAFAEMASAGWEVDEMMNGIEGTMYLAGASGEDLARTAEIVTNTMTAFGMDTDETNKFVNILAETANRTATDVDKMGETFKYVAPAAGALGYNAEDTATAIGIMSNAGIKASQAGTSLRRMLSNFAAPTESSAKAMEKLGFSLTDSNGKMKPLSQVMADLREKFSGLGEEEQVAYAKALAGQNAYTGLLSLVRASPEKFEKVSKAIKGTTNTMDENSSAYKMYNTANDNLTGRLTVLKSTAESAAISIGNRLSPHVEKITSVVQKAADWFCSLSDSQVDLIIKFAGVAAAIGPVTLGIGKLVSGIGKGFKTASSFAKLISKIPSSKGAYRAGQLFEFTKIVGGTALGKIKNGASKIGSVFKTLGTGIVTSARNNFAKVKIVSVGLAKGLFSSIGNGFKKLGSGISTIFKKLGTGILKSFKAIGKGFGTVFKFLAANPKIIIFAVIAAAVIGLVIVIIKNWDKIKPVLQKVGNWFKNLGEKIKEIYNKIKEKTVDFVTNLIEKIKTFVAKAKEQGGFIGAVFKNISDRVQAVKQIFNGFITFIKGVFTGNWKQAWQGVKDIFAGIFANLGAVLKAPLNGVIGLINGAINKINGISFTVPSWVPGLGGKTFGGNLPTIPYLYKGTNNFGGGAAVIHDRGAEIVELPKGTRVIPHDRSLKEAYTTGKKSGGGKSVRIEKFADTIIIREEADLDKLTDKLSRKLENLDYTDEGDAA